MQCSSVIKGVKGPVRAQNLTDNVQMQTATGHMRTSRMHECHECLTTPKNGHATLILSCTHTKERSSSLERSVRKFPQEKRQTRRIPTCHPLLASSFFFRHFLYGCSTRAELHTITVKFSNSWSDLTSRYAACQESYDFPSVANPGKLECLEN